MTMTMTSSSPSSASVFQLRSSGLCLFVSAYLGLFLVAGVVLFSPVVRGPRPSASPFPDDPWDFRDLPGRERLLLNLDLAGTRGLPLPIPSPGAINCSTLHEVRDVEFVAAGWTKAVYRGTFRGGPVAVKTVNLRGRDLALCPGSDLDVTRTPCYRRAAAKLVKEMVLLTRLAPHDNVVKVMGWCVGGGAAGPVVVATELGQPLDTLQLLQLSWRQRLQLALGVARLLHHLAHSALGSLAMNDLRRQQFVLGLGSDGGPMLKLSDVDDMGLAEPTCRTDADCTLHRPLGKNATDWSLRCMGGECQGHNERLNVWHAGRHFVRHLLPSAQMLTDAYERADAGTDEILHATEQLVRSHGVHHHSL